MQNIPHNFSRCIWILNLIRLEFYSILSKMSTIPSSPFNVTLPLHIAKIVSTVTQKLNSVLSTLINLLNCVVQTKPRIPYQLFIHREQRVLMENIRSGHPRPVFHVITGYG